MNYQETGIRYYECVTVFFALDTWQANCFFFLHTVILSRVAYLAVTYYSTLSNKRHDQPKKIQ
jgi:hypothetical protein